MIIIDVPFSAKQAENLKETKEQILKELETIEKFGADETQYFVDRNELEESSTVVEIKNLFNSIIDNFFTDLLDDSEVTWRDHLGERLYQTGGESHGDSPTEAYGDFENFLELPKQLLKLTGAKEHTSAFVEEYKKGLSLIAGTEQDGSNCHGDEEECVVCTDKCPDQIRKELLALPTEKSEGPERQTFMDFDTGKLMVEVPENYVLLLVSYRSGGGHGDADATEEGLRAIIEAKENSEPEETDDHCPTCTCNRSTKFKVEMLRSIDGVAAEDLLRDNELELEEKPKQTALDSMLDKADMPQ
jgi:hypothetical protein